MRFSTSRRGVMLFSGRRWAGGVDWPAAEDCATGQPRATDGGPAKHTAAMTGRTQTARGRRSCDISGRLTGSVHSMERITIEVVTSGRCAKRRFRLANARWFLMPPGGGRSFSMGSKGQPVRVDRFRVAKRSWTQPMPGSMTSGPFHARSLSGQKLVQLLELLARPTDTPRGHRIVEGFF